MADNVITKPLGLVLIATAHMVFAPSEAELIGILCNNITLTFTFKDTDIDHNSDFAVYLNGTKIAEYTKKSPDMLGNVFDISQNTSILYHISKLELGQSGLYSAALFQDPTGFKESDNKVQLVFQMDNSSTTVCPLQGNITTTTESPESTFSFPIIFVLGISLLLLTVASFTLLICCHVRGKAGQQHLITQQNSNTSVQDTVDISNRPPQPPLIYSVLDFPKRPPATSITSDNTEYANISYISEKMHGSMQT